MGFLTSQGYFFLKKANIKKKYRLLCLCSFSLYFVMHFCYLQSVLGKVTFKSNALQYCVTL